MDKLNLPQRPVMGAVILPQPLYDEATRLGYNMTGFIRSAPIPLDPLPSNVSLGSYDGVRFVEPKGRNRHERRRNAKRK